MRRLALLILVTVVTCGGSAGQAAPLPEDVLADRDFVDGDLNKLRALDLASQHLNPAPSTGSDVLDHAQQDLADPRKRVALEWDISGDVRVVQTQNGVRLVLTRIADDASVGQNLWLPHSAEYVAFKLDTLNRSRDDRLEVRWNQVVLESLSIEDIGGERMIRVPLAEIALVNGIRRGELSFWLTGHGLHPSKVAIGEIHLGPRPIRKE